MNGIVASLLVIVLVALVGLAFGIMTFQQETQKEIAYLRTNLNLVKEVYEKNLKAILDENEEIYKDVSEIVKTTTEMANGETERMNELVKGIQVMKESLTKMNVHVIGTGDVDEFLRLKTQVWNNLTPRTSTLEQVVGIKPETVVYENAGFIPAPIENEEKEYDFTFIDCPPYLGIFTQNALAASNGVIVPMTAEVLPFNGLDSIISFIDLVRSSLNREAVLTGVLITRWESTNTTASIEKGLRDSLESLVFRTKIRKNIRVAEAPLMKQDIATYDPKSNGAQDYLAFTEELLEGLEK